MPECLCCHPGGAAFLPLFVGWQAPDITLRSVAVAPWVGTDVTLDFLGNGEIRPQLEALAAELGIAERSDALVLEAMVIGLLLVASAWGGSLDYVSAESRILINPVPRTDFEDRLAPAFVRLAQHPGLRRRMGAVGKCITRRNFDWEKKVDRMIGICPEAAGTA